MTQDENVLGRRKRLYLQALLEAGSLVLGVF